jgi:2-polyprenyl-6-methoxyphenol hydroxylase-like FAD-dependent oxidoreductase
VKVLVIGAGPVGLTMASELARRGVSVRIIDKSHAPSQLSKALAVHARTLEVFEQMGAVDAFLTRGFRVSGMTAWLGPGNRTAEVNLANLDSPYPFVLDIPQSVTEEILIHHLKTFAVEVERQVELLSLAGKDDGVTAVLRHSDGREEIVHTGWVVGCDGAHSTVRHQLGVSFEGTPYPDLFALADVKIHWSLPQDRIQMFLTTDELVAAFPYGEGRYRLMTSIHPTNGDEKPPLAPTLEWFQQVVDSRCGVAATLSDAVWMDTFHSHLRHAKQTRFGRIFLVGDAAHIHSPAGGQGMNTGIQDAYNLAWKLALVAEGSAVQSLLDSYQVCSRAPSITS